MKKVALIGIATPIVLGILPKRETNILNFMKSKSQRRWCEAII
jgi:hypothetical protein